MKLIKSLCMITTLVATSSLYAQTDAENKTQPYGDNPNIFKVLALKTGEAVQNTAEKVGNATERGIQKIKPSFDETIDNTKSYTIEQATIARDNTRQGIDTAVKKVEQTKDRVLSKTTNNVPIEQGSLSQSSNPVSSTQNRPTSVPYTAPIVQDEPIMSQPIQQQSVQNETQNQSNVEVEPEIKKQSLPLTNDSDSTNANSSVNVPAIAPNPPATASSNDDSGVPR